MNLRKVAGRLLGPSLMEEADLVHRVARRRNHIGRMFDVGAHQGRTLLPFAQDGWQVHAFEPDGDNRSHLEQVTKGLTNVIVVPKAVSDERGQLPIYTSAQSSGISSLSPFTESHTPSEVVEVETLARYMASLGILDVGFLKIDVEGFELPVLRGFPWDSVLPEVVLVEFEDAKTVRNGYTWKDLAEFLRGWGYEILISEWYPIVAYGGTHQWRRFARYPSELVDPDGWGNLIAVQRSAMPIMEREAKLYARRVRLSSTVRSLFSRSS
jgi:FkbM family methyltransferase